jgi:hypothetical protein
MRALIVALILVAAAGTAEAYPQFQFSSGASTCKECHFSPAGGGLINDYGRDEAGSDLSTWDGNGGFLHGKWTPPDSFQAGADLRVAVGYYNRSVTGAEGPFPFPMQMEAYLRPKIGPVAIYLNVGVRDSRGNVQPGSREHYVMYESADSTWYVRAGRFFPIYGLRTQDHTANIRRDLGMYLYEEPYGVAYGKYMANSELHVSAFARVPSFDLGTNHDNGVAAYYEHRDEDSTWSYAAQTKLTISDVDRRAWVGGTYKRWLDGPKVLVMGELDLGTQMFPTNGGVSPAALYQLVGYGSATWMGKKGVMLGAGLQAYDDDLRHHGTSRDSAEVNLQWLPYPHVEGHLLVRYELNALDPGQRQALVLAQVHYYL